MKCVWKNLGRRHLRMLEKKVGGPETLRGMEDVRGKRLLIYLAPQIQLLFEYFEEFVDPSNLWRLGKFKKEFWRHIG